MNKIISHVKENGYEGCERDILGTDCLCPLKQLLGLNANKALFAFSSNLMLPSLADYKTSPEPIVSFLTLQAGLWNPSSEAQSLP